MPFIKNMSMLYSIETFTHPRKTSISAGNSNISSANTITSVTILEQDWEMGHRLSRAGAVWRYNNLGHIYPVPFQSPPSKSRLWHPLYTFKSHPDTESAHDKITNHDSRNSSRVSPCSRAAAATWTDAHLGHHSQLASQKPHLHLPGQLCHQHHARIFHKYCPMCFLW